MKDIPQGLKKFAALCSDLLKDIKMTRGRKLTTEEFGGYAVKMLKQALSQWQVFFEVLDVVVEDKELSIKNLRKIINDRIK